MTSSAVSSIRVQVVNLSCTDLQLVRTHKSLVKLSVQRLPVVRTGILDWKMDLVAIVVTRSCTQPPIVLENVIQDAQAIQHNNVEELSTVSLFGKTQIGLW